jgi:hypothetical protein
MPLLDEQRLLQKTGDIRLGVKVPDKSTNGFHPAAIDTFRFTSDSEYAISQVAERLGGTAAEWVTDDRKAGWEVVTERDVIAVLIPPQQVISQDYEMWKRNTLLRRCDSRTEVLSGGECMCPHAAPGASPDEVRRRAQERDELAKQGNACSRYTRLCVQIPSLPDIGVWRLVTGGFYAAGELANKAETLEMARRAGVILPAVLRLTQRQRPARPGEKSRRYVVPVLELLHSVQEIVSGQIPAGLTAAVDTLAIRAAPVLALETAPAVSRPAITMGRPAAPAGEPPLPDEPAGGPDEEGWQRATAIYERAVAATTRTAFQAAASDGESQGLMGEQVCTDRARDLWEPSLRDALTDLFERKAQEERAARGAV